MIFSYKIIFLFNSSWCYFFRFYCSTFCYLLPLKYYSDSNLCFFYRFLYYFCSWSITYLYLLRFCFCCDFVFLINYYNLDCNWFIVYNYNVWFLLIYMIYLYKSYSVVIFYVLSFDLLLCYWFNDDLFREILFFMFKLFTEDVFCLAIEFVCLF